MTHIRGAMIVLLVGLLWGAAPLPAATWEGIDVSMDTDWPGCGRGGYFPIRIHVTNRGQPRVMEFTFTSNYGNVPNVTKTVAVQTERLSFSLLVPCVGEESYGQVRVRVDGRGVSELGQTLSLPAGRNWDVYGPAVLLVDTRDTDWSNYQSALDVVLGATATSSGSSPYYSSSVNSSQERKYVPPESLPGEWQAYTGLDIITLSAANLGRLETDDRAAIVRWVEAGGALLVYAAGDEPQASASIVETLLGEGAPRAAGKEWKTFGSGEGRWSQRDRMLGRLVAVPQDPFRSFSVGQWEALFKGIGRDRWEWIERNGFSARYPSNNFMDFLVPSIRGVPVVAFLVLITLFAIVIGPLNYIYLWKQKRLYLLVVTIPAIAFVTSLSLLGYSVIAHGFSTRVRIRSLTLLDQTTNTAVCASRVSLYSGLAPSSGLDFSRDSAVYPIWAPDTGFESGSVNWTDSQHFQSGWLRSRTRTQFFITTHRKERGRLEITPESETLSISNGFEWDLELVVVANDQGELFFGQGIDAGAGARLEPLTNDHIQKLTQRVIRNPLTPPPHVPSGYGASSYGMYGYYGYSNPATNYSTNLAERIISAYGQYSAYSPAPSTGRWYMAVLKEDPGVDLGMSGAGEEASLHLLKGNY